MSGVPVANVKLPETENPSKNVRRRSRLSPTLVLAERQFVQISPAHFMPLIEARVPFLSLDVRPVLRAHTTHAAQRARIVDRVRVLIVRAQRNAVRQPLVHPQRARIELRRSRR